MEVENGADGEVMQFASALRDLTVSYGYNGRSLVCLERRYLIY